MVSIVYPSDSVHGAYATAIGQSASTAPSQGIPAHAVNHQSAGTDEITVSGLSGLLADPQTPKDSSVLFIGDGGGAVVVPNIPRYVVIPHDCVIVKYTLIADLSGSCVIDVWNAPIASYPPTNANSITAGNEAHLTTEISRVDSTLTGWNKTISAGDVLGFNVDSATTVKWISLMLELART
jgi:hypothetical protein